MRYLVRAKLKPGLERPLETAIEHRSLGRGSVAEGEYLRNMREARRLDDGTLKWVEICYCATPLAEERPYWERYFELTRVQDAHGRDTCRHENGEKLWACEDRDCTDRLERKLAREGQSFLGWLKKRVG